MSTAVLEKSLMDFSLTELIEKAIALGGDTVHDMARSIGHVRHKKTWIEVIDQLSAIEVEAELIPEESPAVEECPPVSRREAMLEEIERVRHIFTGDVEEEIPFTDIPDDIPDGEIKLAIDHPPPPPEQPPIVRPIPERQDPIIPGIEIAEEPEKSPSPGEERRYIGLTGIGYRLHKKIRIDLINHLAEVVDFTFSNMSKGVLDIYTYYDIAVLVERFATQKYDCIYDLVNNFYQTIIKIKEEKLPAHILEEMPALPIWHCGKEDYFLILEKPGPIAVSAESYDGLFIPHRIHELGSNIYLWKFPNQSQAENFFHQVTDASDFLLLGVTSHD